MSKRVQPDSNDDSNTNGQEILTLVNKFTDIHKNIASRMQELQADYNEFKNSSSIGRALEVIQRYDLIMLYGRFNTPEYFLVPVEAISHGDLMLIIFASAARDPESDRFYCVDQVIFPDDSDTEKKRKRNLQVEKHWSLVNLSKKKKVDKNQFPKTREEAEANENNFDKAGNLFYTFSEDGSGKIIKGPLYKFKKSESSIVDCYIRSVYSWKNIL